jgi:hypothetical protein
MNATNIQIRTVENNALTPLDVFRERCEARAILVTHGMMSIQDAVDGLQNAAVAYGLVADLGDDAVQAIMARTFEAHR